MSMADDAIAPAGARASRLTGGGIGRRPPDESGASYPVAWLGVRGNRASDVVLEFMPSGPKISRSMACSQLVRWARPTTSPAAQPMAFEYWNVSRKRAVGRAAIAARR